MLSSEWAREKAEEAEAAGNAKDARAYRELEALWRKRENEKASKLSCVCGKSPNGACIGICALGELQPTNVAD